MPFWRNYVHVVWTTKQRQWFIDDTIEQPLYKHMVNKAGDLGCYVHAINGIADHVHLVLSIPPKHSVADVVKNIKGASSYFVNQVLRPTGFNFEWQRGYGCFSLGHSQLPRAVAYVELQKQHHAQQTTNAWLERSLEVDEGPSEIDKTNKANSLLREQTIGYDVLGDLPF